MRGGLSETVTKFVSDSRTWDDVATPGNPAFRAGPGYYQTSLRADQDLSPIGAIHSRPVL